jgi:DNA-binding SARP family transcriptional activator
VPRRVASALGLTATLAGLPVVLRAAAGPPSLAGLPTWQWLRDGLRDQYLPVDPILHTLGLLAWGLWAYAALVALLRVLAVVAARRRLAGAAALLALSNLVTLAPVRGLLDASIGVGLLAASTRATPTSSAAAAPIAVVRTIQPRAADDAAGWDRARPLLDDARPGSLGDEPTLAQPDPPLLGGAASREPTRTDLAASARPPAGTPTRAYTVEDGDSLWRIAERELGDPLRWREIWALNQGRDMGNGRVFRRAGLILPGWVLHLPAHTEPAGAAPPSPPAGPEHGATATTPAPATPTTTPPPSTPPPSAPAPTPSTLTAPASPSTSAPIRDGRGHDVLELPSGAIVGVSLAGGIALALALARARSRARRRLGQPLQEAPGAIEPEEITRRLDRFAHQRTSALATLADDELDDQGETPTGPPRSAPHAPIRLATWGTPYPARVPLAERDGEEVPVDLVGHGVIAISGEHAADAARAAIVALLGAGNPFHVEVLVGGDGLLGALAGFPGLHRAATLAEALDHVEGELVYRARVLDDEDTPDFPTHRERNADEQPSALMLVTDQAPGEQAGRLAAVHQQGPRLGVGVLLISADPEPGLRHAGLEGVARVRLDEHGRVQAASPATLSDAQLVGARMLRLGQEEAIELLGVLAASRTEPTEQPSPEPDATPPNIQPSATPTPLPEPALHVEPLPPAGAQAPVEVRLLGAYTITTTVQGEIRSGLRRSARELLAFALCHPDGFTAEQAIEALWPDGDPAKTPDWYWNAIANLRRVLARRTSTDKLPSIVRDGARYRPERATFEVDLWRVEAALGAARHAQSDEEVMAALGELAAHYTGGLLTDADYEWARVAREELRRRAVDALARLAELRTAAEDRDGALAVLEQAIEADPAAEELYRRIMRLQAELGRLDAVRRTWHLLEERLDDLGLDPEPASERLRSDLLKPTRRPSRRLS